MEEGEAGGEDSPWPWPEVLSLPRSFRIFPSLSGNHNRWFWLCVGIAVTWTVIIFSTLALINPTPEPRVAIVCEGLLWQRHTPLQEQMSRSVRLNDTFEGDWDHVQVAGKTLVIYVYFEKNLLYRENLETFLQVGVDSHDDVDYLFIIQGNSPVSLPEYPNVRVIRKENECLDFGGWRFGLEAIAWRGGHYRYFVFMNSSVRGPYVPLYVPPSIHWTRLFTQMLREEGDGYGSDNGPIKLVGMTISCYNNRPHVQSMLWATDLEALEFLIDETEVVTCKKSMPEAIDFGEIALSSKILNQGWNIGSLSVAYRGWDFRRQRACNDNRV